ncbi:MAG: cation transporter [Thermodesulfovibrionales bacterium]
MRAAPALAGPDRERLYRWAYLLALVTIYYNLAEGAVSVFFGLEDETAALFGFGLDSFVEVVSGLGVWHMLRRLRKSGDEGLDRFERQALRITGSAFYILAAGLVATAAVNLYTGHRPETTFWGVVISLVSIATMWALIHFKVKVGRRLGSQAILADAACTRTCLYLSAVLLASSAGYELTGAGGIDALGAAAIAVISFREGREAFQKASSGGAACACGGGGGP